VHGLGPARSECCAERFDFIEAAGLAEIRLFCDSGHRVHYGILAQAAGPEHAGACPNVTGTLTIPAYHQH
jgi:hypothetical protein